MHTGGGTSAVRMLLLMLSVPIMFLGRVTKHFLNELQLSK